MDIAALTDIAEQRETVASARFLVERMRECKAERKHARRLFDQLRINIKLLNTLARLPECAGWREDYLRIVADLSGVREEARAFLNPHGRKCL
jgi:elongation factor P--beta-lysine ligase